MGPNMARIGPSGQQRVAIQKRIRQWNRAENERSGESAGESKWFVREHEAGPFYSEGTASVKSIED